MNIVKLLEELANNTHHRVAIEALIQGQPDEIHRAFISKKASQLKKAICHPYEVIADRSGIIQVTKS